MNTSEPNCSNLTNSVLPEAQKFDKDSTAIAPTRDAMKMMLWPPHIARDASSVEYSRNGSYPKMSSSLHGRTVKSWTNISATRVSMRRSTKSCFRTFFQMSCRASMLSTEHMTVPRSFSPSYFLHTFVMRTPVSRSKMRASESTL